MSKELSVDVPPPARDRPAWVKVGVIAVVGFVVGIAWPRVVGVRLGPSAPGDASASASASAVPGRAPDAPPASVAAKAPASAVLPAAAASSAATPAALPPQVTVAKGVVLSCKTSDGDTKKGAKDCGPVANLDLVVSPRLRKIATCSGMEGQTGKIVFVASADFATGRFWYELAKSTTVPNLPVVDGCLRNAFRGVTVGNLSHEHPRYTVSYVAVLALGAAGDVADNRDDKHDKTATKDPDEKQDTTPTIATGGEAQVAWEVALVRDAPKTGAVVARLPRGTKVKVGTTKEGWYAIKFGDDFNTDGWVYRGAIAK